MQKPSRRDAGTAAAAVSAEAPISPRLDQASMSDIAHALATGHVTATVLVKAYLARIEAYDRDEPKLNAVRALNPDGVRQHARDRHARRLFVPGRS
ncbi:hypothetical protein [Bradyrhizobium vignae]|uniref:hypothetical protein n=1 Tax=Bradyrhizobium vignae TaxID=1549949 RepID=UPI001FE20302|nr:hypothetical protein [Bradyrhizobium vignae]